MISTTEIIFQDISKNEEYEELTEKVIQKCFEVEKINPTSLYICVTFTTPENIRQANKQYRDIDKETDVLSFPMFEKEELDKIIAKHLLENWKVKLGDCVGQEILGDIIISIARVKEQAKEYGHSFLRELSFLTIHGLLHLLGYDHMKKEEEKIMFQKQEDILNEFGITRGN